MDYKRTAPKVILKLLWMIGLGCITAILLGAGPGEDSGFVYYLKLYGVGVLWLVFLLLVFRPRGATRLQVSPRRLDKVVLFLLLAALLAILLAQLARLLIGLQVFPALLLGLVCVGLFNVLRAMLAERDR